MKPVVANNKPLRVTLTAGEKYHWCSCGRSENQPFCDGSHVGTGLTPFAFIAEKSEDVWLCCCKQTLNRPLCDGRHKQIADEQVGKELFLGGAH